jgi:aspartyl-tRNA(Asn)/glutamyl-tRNA(Gln) amidotransferase subunit A
VFGLKPSFGRVPIDPPYIGRVAGPMTRSVDDSALLMSCLSRPDRRDYMSLPPEEVHWGELSSEVSNLRIALMLDAGCGTEPSPDILKAVEGAATLLASAGAYVEPIKPLLTSEMLNGLDRFWRTRFFEDTRHLDGDQYQKILPYIRSWVEPAAAYSGLEVYNGFNQIIKMQEAGNRQMADFDFLISPTAPEPAFPAEWASPTNDPQLPFEHIGYTVAYNMTGQPAASINCGFTENGLPIGLQIVGKRFDDLGVLRLARAFENLRAAPKPWPKPWEFANS